MNKLYLFLVLLAIVSCLKRDDEEIDDSTEVVSTSAEDSQDYSEEYFKNLAQRAIELDENCQSLNLSPEEHPIMAEVCDRIKQFVESTKDSDELQEKIRENLPNIKRYIEESGEDLYEICKSGVVSADDYPDLAQACEALDQYLESQNAGDEEITQDPEVVPVVEVTE